ncbi:hypothetical protein pb186bvf_005718 [Paramecium bursaria]
MNISFEVITCLTLATIAQLAFGWTSHTGQIKQYPLLQELQGKPSLVSSVHCQQFKGQVQQVYVRSIYWLISQANFVRFQKTKIIIIFKFNVNINISFKGNIHNESNIMKHLAQKFLIGNYKIVCVRFSQKQISISKTSDKCVRPFSVICGIWLDVQIQSRLLSSMLAIIQSSYTFFQFK